MFQSARHHQLLTILATPLAFLGSSAPAATFGINSTTGAASSPINGVTVTFAGNVANNTIAQFIVHGDLVLLDGDLLTGSGTRGISLLVADDVEIAAGATIDCSA